jgi:hypothetical protein
VCWVMYLVFNSAVYIHIVVGWGWMLDVVQVVALLHVLEVVTWRDSEKCASKLCNHEHKKCCACNPTARSEDDARVKAGLMMWLRAELQEE